MRDRIVITVLVIILGLLIFRLGAKRLNSNDGKEEVQEENVEVLRMMSEMENEYAYECYLRELAVNNESTSCSLGYLEETEDSETSAGVFENASTDRIGVETNDKLPEYSKLYPDLYVDKICPECAGEGEKIAFLTFDDGPSENTLKVLDVLEEKGAVATFFVLGSTMTEDGETALQRMTQMGCKIGIHTYSHKKNVIYSSIEGFLDDFYKVYTQIYELTGEKVNIYRFPWGSYNSYSKSIKKDLVAEMDRRGFTYYDWNVSAEDSVGAPTESSIMKNILKDVTKYNQPVILMHDSSINDLTAQMLPTVIDKLIELGYSFGTLDEREPCQFCY